MYKKIRSRLSSAIEDLGDPAQSASQEKRKYVLEDVFWVPVNNCSSRRSTSGDKPERRSGKHDPTAPADSNNLARGSTRKRIRDRYLL
jgi:hypothetical protein